MSQRDTRCPYCGTVPDIVLSAHIRFGHVLDAAGDHRCPGVVRVRESLGLPPAGHGGDVPQPNNTPKHRDPDTGEFITAEDADA
jgi:hypothetical protein